MINVILLAIILILATLSGMVIFAYYDLAGCDPLKGKQVSNANQVGVVNVVFLCESH